MLTPGTIIGGDFRVVRPLREGGMGAVYVVEQLSIGETRALKVMLEGAHGPGDSERSRKVRQRFPQFDGLPMAIGTRRPGFPGETAQVEGGGRVTRFWGPPPSAQMPVFQG